MKEKLKIIISCKKALVFLLLSLVAVFLLSCTVVAPAYVSPLSRTYGSSLGYQAMARRLKKPFRVETEKVVKHTFVQTHVGEGMMASQEILVPIIPMSRVRKVHVVEGQFVKKGDLLIELDESLAKIKLSSAELAAKTAGEELGRVDIGSAYVLAQERPEKDKIEMATARGELNVISEKLNIYKKLLNDGSISRNEYLEIQLKYNDAKKRFDTAKFYFEMSSKGQRKSMNIAKNAVSEARNALQAKGHDLGNHKIFSSADGIVERILIHEGEYNQDSGRPAIILASGLWFEAHLDQVSIGQVSKGDISKIYLEAFPGRVFKGRVSQINPIVSYNAGGPEINRPIRPRGSSTPEWPSTFAVRIHLDAKKGVKLFPGLTGFARLTTENSLNSISKKAVTSLSISSGIVAVPNGETFELKSVATGISDESRVEILSGLSLKDTVISSGREGLEKGDLVSLGKKSSLEEKHS